MSAHLPDEVLLEIGKYIRQSSLASMCQVSKQFNHLFAPLLYRHMWIDEDSWNVLLNQIPDSRYSFIQRLTMGRLGTAQSPKKAEREFLAALRKMGNLCSIVYVYFHATAFGLLLLTVSIPGPLASWWKVS